MEVGELASRAVEGASFREALTGLPSPAREAILLEIQRREVAAADRALAEQLVLDSAQAEAQRQARLSAEALEAQLAQQAQDARAAELQRAAQEAADRETLQSSRLRSAANSAGLRDDALGAGSGPGTLVGLQQLRAPSPPANLSASAQDWVRREVNRHMDRFMQTREARASTQKSYAAATAILSKRLYEGKAGKWESWL